MQMNQSVTVTATPEDANGNPGTIVQAPTWSAPAGITVTPSQDGLSAVVASGTTPGTFQVDVKFTAVNLGPSIVDSFDVVVSEVPATQVVFSFGTPS